MEADPELHPNQQTNATATRYTELFGLHVAGSVEQFVEIQL